MHPFHARIVCLALVMLLLGLAMGAYGLTQALLQIPFDLNVVAALLTSFYSWRLIFLTFFGKPRADHHTMEHIHESPWIMLGRMIVVSKPLPRTYSSAFHLDLW